MPNCLLVVDVQHGFINPHTRHVPARVEALQSGYDVVFATRFHNPDPSFYRTMIGWHRLGRETDDFRLAFVPKNDARIIDKPIYTCVDKLFIAELHGLGIDAVDVCGIDTDICVTKCAVDLFEANIAPRVLASHCASTAGEQAHENALATLRRYIGKSQVVE